MDLKSFMRFYVGFLNIGMIPRVGIQMNYFKTCLPVTFHITATRAGVGLWRDVKLNLVNQ